MPLTTTRSLKYLRVWRNVVYGPLCNGGTTVLFESIPTFPNPGKEPEREREREGPIGDKAEEKCV